MSFSVLQSLLLELSAVHQYSGTKQPTEKDAPGPAIQNLPVCLRSLLDEDALLMSTLPEVSMLLAL